MITYVTYDEAGNLTGFYIQELQPAHEAMHIVLADAADNFYMWWPMYRANAARDGVELIPPPEDPPVEPDPV